MSPGRVALGSPSKGGQVENTHWREQGNLNFGSKRFVSVLGLQLAADVQNACQASLMDLLATKLSCSSLKCHRACIWRAKITRNNILVNLSRHWPSILSLEELTKQALWAGMSHDSICKRFVITPSTAGPDVLGNHGEPRSSGPRDPLLLHSSAWVGLSPAMESPICFSFILKHLPVLTRNTC